MAFSVGLVLILDAVHWNPETHHERYRAFVCGAVRHHPVVPTANFSVREKSIDSSEEPEAKRYAGIGGREKNSSEERNWGSQCFFTSSEMRQPRDALLLTP
ncbi:hypothetical protein GQ457_02G039860 [Hibiscus cannabinus]